MSSSSEESSEEEEGDSIEEVEEEKERVLEEGIFRISEIDRGIGGAFAVCVRDGGNIKGKPNRVRIPINQLPSLSPYLLFRMRVVASDKPVTLDSVTDVQPMKITIGMVSKVTGKRCKNGSKEAKLIDIPSNHLPAFGIAFRKPSFYRLMTEYPVDLLLRLPDSTYKKIWAARTQTYFYLWEALRARISGLPYMGALCARSRPPTAEIAAGQAMYAMMLNEYAESGKAVFTDYEDASQLEEWGIISEHRTFKTRTLQENALLGKFDVNRTSIIHTGSLDSDYAELIKQVQSADLVRPAVVLAPSPQMAADLRMQGLANVRLLANAVSATISAKSCVVAAAHLATCTELLAIITAPHLNRVTLIGDATHRTGFPETEQSTAGFAILFAKAAEAGAHATSPWPTHIQRAPDASLQASRCWQRDAHLDLVSGRSSRTLFANVSMEDWSQLELMRPKQRGLNTLFLFFSSRHLEAAKDAAKVNTRKLGLRMCVSVPSRGIWGDIKKISAEGVDPVALTIGETEITLRHEDKVRPGRYEMLTRYSGTPCHTVVVVIEDDTPRALIATALKFATDSFKIVFAPDAKRKTLGKNPLVQPDDRTIFVKEAALMEFASEAKKNMMG